MTVEEMLARMGSSELSDWEEYWNVEPFGPRHADRRFAILGARLANLWKAKNSPRANEEDFIPAYTSQHKGSPEGDKALLAALEMSGAKVVRRKRGSSS